MIKYMLNKRYDVKDAEASKEFGEGDKREDYADAWNNTGNVILVGLPGSGKANLAGLLAERTGLDVLNPTTAEEATQGFDWEGAIVVLNESLVADEVVQPLIHGAGKVFYLMVDSSILSERVTQREGGVDREQLWRELSARLAAMEPVFYATLHFILQAAQTPEDMVEDALEKIAY